MALKEYVVSFVSSEKTCGPIPIENSLTGILKNLAVKKCPSSCTNIIRPSIATAIKNVIYPPN